MKSLKNHFSVIFPLIVILMSIQFTFNLEKIVKNYESKLIEDYSIVVVSSKLLTKNDLISSIKDLKSLDLMSAKKVLERLKGDISSKNLSLLQVALPKFYSLKLTSFPTTKKLKYIKTQLKKNPSITKVETFSKTHDKIYNIFVIAKYTSYIFTSLMLVISFLLMLKQMRIWLYEHKERMDIMTLFGAPFWMKSAVLFRLAVIDSLLATIVVVGIFYSLPFMSFFHDIADKIDILIPNINLLSEGIILLCISLVFGLFSVSMVMFRLRKG